MGVQGQRAEFLEEARVGDACMWISLLWHCSSIYDPLVLYVLSILEVMEAVRLSLDSRNE